LMQQAHKINRPGTEHPGIGQAILLQSEREDQAEKIAATYQ